jgi:predicted O-linked N-acetylglucosamine transferase (SPINDLY family)
VSPWDGEVNGFPPELILAMAQSFSCFAKVGEGIGPLRPIDEFPIIIYVSSDLGDHPSAHLWSAELMEMETSREAQVWVLCLANEKRLKDLDSGNSPFRGALKERYGARFLELGHLTDKAISKKVNNEIRPNIVYVCGWHQEGVRLGAVAGITGTVIVQAVAHASTTGSRKVDYVLCNSRVLPEENRKYFFEKPLYIDAPFLPNSFHRFFNQFSSRLNQLRIDGDARSEHRSLLGLPAKIKLIANIAKPNRFDEPYLEMVTQVLDQNPHAHLVLVDHGCPAFRRRMEARFKGRIQFMPFQDLSSGKLHDALAVTDLYLDTLGYNGHTAAHDHLWANGVLVTVMGKSLTVGLKDRG